ncbi:hypothetical protein, partial [Helicobacter sp. 12S02232-10]|uniref:hypothetical protein n=1 Tax=Helicobacter sp. 12S02232-10 TaxID=1476197 RepID=UPI0015DDC0E6
FFKYYLVYPKISGKETRDLENEKENQAKEINDAFRQQFSTASKINDLRLYSFIINLIADGLINPNGSLKAAGGLNQK